VFVGVAELDYTANGCYMAVTNLAERLGVDRGTVHRALAELEARGFLYRIRTADGREAWKVRPFAMSAKTGGYALVWPVAVKRIVSARHFRAYAVCVRENGRPHGRDITAALIAAALVNLGPADGRGRRVPKTVSLDTAQRVLDDLTLSGWLTARRQGRAGLATLYTPQTNGLDDVTREWCAGVRRMTTQERRAALTAAELGPERLDEGAPGDAPEAPSLDEGSEPSSLDAPDEGTRQGAAERAGDPAGDVHSPSPPSPSPPGPAASSEGAKPEDPQVTEPGPSADIHNIPQPCDTMTGQSPEDMPQRYDSHSPQPHDAPSRNGDALDELARRASSEPLPQPPVVRNGPVVDAHARDDLSGDHDNGHDTDSAEQPSSGAVPDPAPEAGGEAGGLLVDGVPLRVWLEDARRAGPATRPAGPGPERRGPPVALAQLRLRLAGIESAHTPPRPPGPPPPPARRGRRPGPGE
jgi:DNA-binding Lrp family transcriptional regulator